MIIAYFVHLRLNHRCCFQVWIKRAWHLDLLNCPYQSGPDRALQTISRRLFLWLQRDRVNTFKGLVDVTRLGLCLWCSVTHSALICVYCSSYLSCVAAFSPPDIDIHCRSRAAPWAMWINTANTTPLKHHNPFCFGGSSPRCVCKWESLFVFHTKTHTNKPFRAHKKHTLSSLSSLCLSKAVIYL